MKLSAVQVARLKKPGRYYDGKGLVLQITQRGSKSWLYRYELNSREHCMGLGPLDLVSLAEARDKAREARKLLKVDGVDPLAARRQARTIRPNLCRQLKSGSIAHAKASASSGAFFMSAIRHTAQ